MLLVRGFWLLLRKRRRDRNLHCSLPHWTKQCPSLIQYSQVKLELMKTTTGFLSNPLEKAAQVPDKGSNKKNQTPLPPPTNISYVKEWRQLTLMKPGEVGIRPHAQLLFWFVWSGAYLTDRRTVAAGAYAGRNWVAEGHVEHTARDAAVVAHGGVHRGHPVLSAVENTTKDDDDITLFVFAPLPLLLYHSY